MYKISIILPAYNEAKNIIHLIKALEKKLTETKYSYEIIVVDDNSPDQTWKIVADYAGNHSNIKLINRESERGLTSALNMGVHMANGDIAVWMDCDFSHSPEILNNFLSELNEEVDVVIGSRWVPGGADKRKGSYLFQRYLSLILSKTASFMIKIPVKDVTSGYIAIKKQCLDQVGPLEGDYGEYFIDLLCKLNKANYRIKEIPMIFKNREVGESKTATNWWDYFRRGIKYLRMLYKHH